MVGGECKQVTFQRARRERFRFLLAAHDGDERLHDLVVAAAVAERVGFSDWDPLRPRSTVLVDDKLSLGPNVPRNVALVPS